MFSKTIILISVPTPVPVTDEKVDFVGFILTVLPCVVDPSIRTSRCGKREHMSAYTRATLNIGK